MSEEQKRNDITFFMGQVSQYMKGNKETLNDIKNTQENIKEDISLIKINIKEQKIIFDGRVEKCGERFDRDYTRLNKHDKKIDKLDEVYEELSKEVEVDEEVGRVVRKQSVEKRNYVAWLIGIIAAILLFVNTIFNIRSIANVTEKKTKIVYIDTIMTEGN